MYIIPVYESSEIFRMANNGSLKTRLLMAAVACPFLFCSIYFFPGNHHLIFCVIVAAVSAVGCWELKNNIIKKKMKTPPTAYLGMLFPVVELVNVLCFPEIELTQFCLAAFVGISFLYETLTGAKDDFHKSIERTAAVLMNIAYPGLFMCYGIKLCYLPSPTAMIFTFLCVVFGSDSLAYFCGMAFGKNNKGIVKCSPNKSIAGFIGGTFLVGIVGAVVVLLNPDLLPFTPLEAGLLFFFTSVFGTAGDLFESMLKRSAGVKDAGVIVPGRGGMLDCIDSISIALPIFVVGVEFIVL